MKKILITGASGFLGAHLCQYLSKKYKITALCSSPNVSFNKRLGFIEEVLIGDIRDEKLIIQLKKKKFDIVVHLVSLDHHKSEDMPNFVSSINVMPTWNLLNELTKNSLSKFIYFSTFHVYGLTKKKVISEELALNPLNAYGLTHQLSEKICNYYNQKTKTECINVRLSNAYGSPIFIENNCWSLVINDLCKTAFFKEKIKLFSDGSPQRDFIHTSDICKSIEYLIESNKNLDENIFNLASGKTYTILELAKIVQKVFETRYKKKIKIELQKNLEESDNKNKSRFSIDVTRIKRTGFKATKSIEKGVQEVFNYLETNQNNFR